MAKTITIRNLYNQKRKPLGLTGGWLEAMGDLSRSGIWLIYGKEKNGKTGFALQLANYLSTIERVLYVSAEEGVDDEFVDSVKRAKVAVTNNRLHVLGYETLAMLDERLGKRKTERIVFVDNLTIYNDEFKTVSMVEFCQRHNEKLLIFIAHEERGLPYTAAAKIVSKLAKCIMNVKGLVCEVHGRKTEKPNRIVIDAVGAAVFHGEGINN